MIRDPKQFIVSEETRKRIADEIAFIEREAAQLRADVAMRNIVIEQMKDRVTSAETALQLSYDHAEQLRADFEAEKAIVNRIWDQLGRPSYEELNGRSIYDLIDALRADRDALEVALRAMITDCFGDIEIFRPTMGSISNAKEALTKHGGD